VRHAIARGYVAGMGSNNVVVVDRDGAREAIEPIAVGQGPAALALDEVRGVLWVWNHFDASLSRVALDALRETDRVALHTPVPAAIRDGRPFLYDTQRTSGTGHLSCASCHVDARIDRLAWDLGDPSGTPKAFDQNCATAAVGFSCSAFHPVKGPMLTMTMQDVIGKEPLHWRGDRGGIEGFHPTYIGLQGRSASITAAEMASMKQFLATVVYPPNPFRREDNSLPTDLVLAGHESTGRFAAAGTPMPNGNAQRGLELFRTGRQSVTPGANDNCSVRHSLPTGFGPNASIIAIDGVRLGGTVFAPGPNGENHLAIVANGTVSDKPFKVASLRNLYERTGFDMQSTRSRTGFGFLHDGTVDSLARYMSLDAFVPRNDQDIADFVALLLAFSGSDLARANPQQGAPGPDSNDTHASAGRQATASAGDTAAAAALAALAASPRLELVARVPDGTRSIGWLQRADGTFTSDTGANAAGIDASLASLAPASRATFTLVPEGTGERVALDRDGDGVRDGTELAQGSRPYDPASSTLSPAAGLWFNPARSGHGMDIERAGEVLAATWYTYLRDGSPVWYQAVARFDGARWTAPLNRYSIAADGSRPGQVVGSLTLEFADAEHATMRWTIGTESGSEPFERGRFGPRERIGLNTGTWYDAADGGWGLTLDSQGDVTVGVVYFYDGSGAPRWVLGTANTAGGTMPLGSFRGFCPACAFAATTSISGGTLTFGIESAGARTLALAAFDAASPAAVWRRTTRITRLSDPVRDPLAE